MPRPVARYVIKADDKTKAAVSSANAGFKKIAGTVGAVAKGAAVLGAALGVGVIALTRASLDAIDSLAKTADAIGITTEKLQAMRHATALYTNVDIKQMDKALVQATKRLGEFAQTGAGTAGPMLKKLGLDTQELLRLKPDELFERYGEEIRKMGSKAERLAATNLLLGDRSGQMLNIIEAGGDIFADAREELDLFGVSVSRVDAAKIEAANDSFTRVKSVFEGIGNTLSKEVSPFMEVLNKQFIEAAKEGGGIGPKVSASFDALLGAIGFVADAIHGLRVVAKGIELIMVGANAAIIISFDELNKSIAQTLNLIPGVNIKPSAGLSEWAENSRQQVIALEAEIISMVNAELPSDKFKKFTDEVKVAAQEAAEEVVALKKAAADSVPDGAGDTGDTGGAGQVKADDKTARALEKIQERFASERSLLDEHLAAEKEIIANSDAEKFEKDLLIEQLETEHQAKLTSIAAKAADKRKALDKAENAARVSAIQSGLANLSSLMQSGSKKLFEVGKIAARANVIISSYQAIQNALAVTPYPLGVALAATAAVKGAANLAAINRTSFGGGGSINVGGSGGGGGGGIAGAGGGGSFGIQGGGQQNGFGLPAAPVEAITKRKIDVIGKDSDTITVGQMREIVDNLKDGSQSDEFTIEITDGRGVIR